MIYGYARVSTIGQDLDIQIEKLKEAGCDKIFIEKFTGTKINRPEFQKIMKVIQAGDTFVATKLDRFARSTIEGLQTTKELFERGIKVHILNLGLIENTPTGRLILANFFAFSEFERDLILERTAEGKQRAKQQPNFREGRPKQYSSKQIAHALDLLEVNSYREVTALTGISKSTLIRAKRLKK
ncbi:recombinase family protein [Listeria seeligeri]|uniref:recombinase family protein n=1 Tax=Listeria seeligeri TaxID=1640 RepID=UPI0010B9F91B|nr:recombinase family protein [Listeria seeligeri]EAC2922393.1 recombinase family protein [Listeria monocytogenes]MBC1557003.1 recombinase family protein [Listeria seeligeri]HAB0718277.1 recombinase family protein [Listeria monocytogenes]